MSLALRISLLIFAIFWFLLVLILLKKDKLPIKYSLIWFAADLTIFLVTAFPIVLVKLSELLGFVAVSNLVIGLLLTLLLIITLVLTMLVYRQRKLIVNLIQEVSIMKKR